MQFEIDFRNFSEVASILVDKEFDVVLDFICYNEEQARIDIELFKNKVKHFFFISTVSVYDRVTKNIPYSEKARVNPNSIREYAVDKLKAENLFLNAYEEFDFPATIIRPGYTYDTIIPVSVGLNDWTVCKRILDDKPPIIMGDGSNIYTFTHSKDFADALTALFLNESSFGEIYNITSDEINTWKEATDILIDVLGIPMRSYLYTNGVFMRFFRKRNETY